MERLVLIMSIAAAAPGLPTTIQSKLRTVFYRHAFVLTLRSMAIAAFVFVILLLFSMMMDWRLPFMGSATRYILKYGTLMGAVVSFLASVWSPFRRMLGWDRVAGTVDQHVPALQQRWSTVSNLAGRDLSRQTALERAMASHVTTEAIAMERVVVPSRIAAPASPQKAVLAAAGATLVLSTGLVIAPVQISLLLHRFWAPDSTLTATQIVSSSGDAMVPRGQKVKLVGLLTGIPRSNVTLVLIGKHGDEKQLTLRSDAPAADRFEHSLRLEESMSYQWIAGDGRSPIYDLQVIDYPSAAEIDFTVDYPEYTGRAPIQRDRMPRRVRVPENSMLRVGIRSDIPLGALQLSTKSSTKVIDDSDSQSNALVQQMHELQPDSDGWYRFETLLTEDVAVQACLVSPHGLNNQRRLLSKIDVITDQAPVARIVGATDETAVAQDDEVAIEFEAHDDHGIVTAELVIYDEQHKDANGLAKVLAVRKIPLGDQRIRKHVKGQALLDLKALGVSPNTEISYAIRVTDNRADGSSMTGNKSDNARQDQTEKLSSSNKPKLPEGAAASKMETNPRIETPVENALQRLGVSSAEDAPASIASIPVGTDMEPDELPTTSSDDLKKMGEGLLAMRPGEDARSARPSSESSLPNDADAKQPTNSDRQNGLATKRDMKSTKNMLTDDASKATTTAVASGNPGKASSTKTNSLQGKPATKQTHSATTASATRAPNLKMQRNRSGQNTTTRRRRIRVTERLAAIPAAEARPGEDRQIRQSVVEIDRMLAEIELGLRNLVDHAIADSDRAEQFRRLDTSLANVESFVADLRSSTRENQFAFVGLQMVDITRSHVTPARDRVFQAIQRPAASDADASASLQQIVRGRELLAALLKRYDRVVQEKKLKKDMDEAVAMYEVYQQKRRLLMREARQNQNPLERKMEVVEVDQEYLDRLAEVAGLRREMLDEFAEMLGDDPRLLSRYLELIKRRDKSLRDRLTDISERQYEAAEETLGWMQIDASQLEDYWMILAELRLTLASDLAKDAAQLSERIEKQLPLELGVDEPLVADLLDIARVIAGTARQMSFDAEEMVVDTGSEIDASSIIAEANRLVPMFDRLSASLDQLQYGRPNDSAVPDYVEPRLLEAQVVRDLADSWRVVAEALAIDDYLAIVQSEQHQLAIDTQLLRVEMLEMRTELDAQFQRIAETALPEQIAKMIHALHHKMEAITFNQIAASIRAGSSASDAQKTAACSLQQQMAMERLEQAEDLFDQIRRAVVRELDQYDMRDPNIGDLRDPTLDEFLARLEREPNIVRQLGIPNRKRNLRALSDSMLWNQNGSEMLGSSGSSAGDRARQAMKMEPKQAKRDKDDPKELSKEEQQRRDEAQKAQQMLEKSLVEIKKRIDASETEDTDRERLEDLAKEIERAINQSGAEDIDRVQWDQMVKSDEAKRLLMGIAGGDSMAKEQWNKLLSTLDDGLWQVRGKQPPEAYRKAIQQYQDQLRELTGVFDE